MKGWSPSWSVAHRKHAAEAMTRIGAKGLWRASAGLRWRRLNWRFGRHGAVILLYHRVAEASCDPWGICVSPRHFAEHMAALRKVATPIPLRQLYQALENGHLPRRSVVVTFDDGYADNLHHAKPVLERYDVPATVFLTTGYVRQGREYWWDTLTRVLLQPGERLPDDLRLRMNGSWFEWRLDEAAFYDAKTHGRSRSWRLADDPPTGRHALCRELWRRLKAVPPAEQERVLNEVLAWAGATSMSNPAHRPLSVEEARSLARSELIEIGAHTVTHPVLSAQAPALQRAEIRQSKTECEEIVGRPVTSFSYPHGDYTEESVSAVAEAGFICACTTEYRSVCRGSDRLRLPRVYVGDWGGETFAEWLSRGI
jgi:peptidoglycan/xylan/chitin deacetylase (PgdA/CDA1 family)